jgi:hypothetical protein
MKSYNKRVAVVYFSAALLIVSVGVRMVGSLLSESGQGLSPLDWVMVVGFTLEFFVLTYYSSFIWTQPDEEGEKQKFDHAGTDQELLVQIREFQKMEAQKAEQTATLLRACHDVTLSLQLHVTQLQQTSSVLVSQLNSNEGALQQSANNLVAMEKTLKEFIEGKMHEQVETEVREIMSSIVLQRISSKDRNETKS